MTAILNQKEPSDNNVSPEGLHVGADDAPKAQQRQR
jgi:hypothetical protein